MRQSFVTAINIFSTNNGILKMAQADKLGVDSKTLLEMTDAGLLVKESRGVYRLANMPPLSNPDLVQVAMRVPAGVVCLISALAFHNLTTQIPHKVYIALPTDVKKPRIDYPPIEVIWLSEKTYSNGMEEHTIDGVKVRIYNREKTVADCFRFRNKIGQDIALEALKDYLRRPDRNIEHLLNYARINRMHNVMMPFLKAAL
ncbi:MAG: type IV toxin-antitoxin system AbiEi family antitoxin domain-containing protein [Anaerolineales bacterium]|nr:type IV toxin-antitoxin system AbiEi family antitoxin domain-containing protein [Anaerolineales bacterium]